VEQALMNDPSHHHAIKLVAQQSLSIAQFQRLKGLWSLVRSERRETDLAKIDDAMFWRDLRSWSPSLPQARRQLPGHDDLTSPLANTPVKDTFALSAHQASVA
jgi:hypothetical protein